MKRLIYIFLILFCACGMTSEQDHQKSSIDTNEMKVKVSAQADDAMKISEEVAESESLKSLETFKEFAQNYSPSRKPNSGVAMLPETPDSVLSAIRVVRDSQPKEFEKYITLIFVKLYSAHLECCHQSYEVRKEPQSGLDQEKDPLVYEFNNFTKKYPAGMRIEFISSSLVYDYLISHRYLLELESINKHFEIIEQVNKNIEAGAYWE
jgi:hypothetical protein